MSESICLKVNKVSLMLKVDEMVKGLLVACAKVDRRTMSAYVEALIEADAKAKRIVPEMLKPPKVKEAKEEEVKATLPDYVDRLLWKDWSEHRRDLKRPITSSAFKQIVVEMDKATANGHDVNELMRKALAKGWKDFIYPNHLVGSEEVVSDEDKARFLQRAKLCEQLGNIFIGGLLTPSIYNSFITMMRETDQLVDVPQINWLLDQLRSVGKGIDWNDAILQRAIDTRYVLNESGRFDVLRSEERI